MSEKRTKKSKKSLPVPLNEKTMERLIELQGEYQVINKRKIVKAAMAGIVIDETIKDFHFQKS